MTPSQYITTTSREYAIYVNSNRAIPNVQDGLKHVQRIALWLLARRAEKIKTVALGGLMSAERLYVHGDVSANNAIGMLAAPFRNNVMLIEGLGQFGSRVAPVEGIGAPRYTEVRRAKASEAFLYADLDIVPLRENYDGSNREPVHFLPLIPTVLLNGVSGVAVGWSTEIMPRSLKGLVQATLDALDGREELRGLEPAFARYDVDVRHVAGNQWEFSGKAEIEDTSTIRVRELPPGLSVVAFRQRLIEMEENETIMSFTDRSTESIDITIKMKRGSVKDWKPEKALTFFKLREKSTERIVVIDWCGTKIRPYEDAPTLVRDFVAWRLSWYTTRFEKLRADAAHECNFWRVMQALYKAKFPAKLGKFADRKAMEAEVEAIARKAKLTILDGQMERVVGLATHRWTVEFETEIEAKIAALDAEIAGHDATLKDPERLKAVYRGEIEALKKLK